MKMISFFPFNLNKFNISKEMEKKFKIPFESNSQCIPIQGLMHVHSSPIF